MFIGYFFLPNYSRRFRTWLYIALSDSSKVLRSPKSVREAVLTVAVSFCESVCLLCRALC